MVQCHYCRKKTLVSIECKCKHNFCTFHSLPEKHKCENIYDFHRQSFENNKEKVMNQAVKPNLHRVVIL